MLCVTRIFPRLCWSLIFLPSALGQLIKARSHGMVNPALFSCALRHVMNATSTRTSHPTFWHLVKQSICYLPRTELTAILMHGSANTFPLKMMRWRSLEGLILSEIVKMRNSKVTSSNKNSPRFSWKWRTVLLVKQALTLVIRSISTYRSGDWILNYGDTETEVTR